MDEAAKIAWGNEMRRQFSPAGVSLEDGSINQDFFKPKKIIIQLTEAKRWGEQEKAALLKFIRLKTARLLGIQSLARHMGWKGDTAAVEAEYAKHKKIGEALGCWKGGVLVENDAGQVAQALAE
eukprot:jgi/Picre1/29467/NNA_004855.t1